MYRIVSSSGQFADPQRYTPQSASHVLGAFRIRLERSHCRTVVVGETGFLFRSISTVLF